MIRLADGDKMCIRDSIYTDVWVSMGEPDEVWAERIKLLEPYRVTEEVMAMASKDAIFLHCLPSFHDKMCIRDRPPTRRSCPSACRHR